MKEAEKISAHETFESLPQYVAPKVDPKVYLRDLQVDPDGVLAAEDDGPEALKNLNLINQKYHKVYNGDLSVGYI